MADRSFEKLIKDSIDFGAGVFYYSKEKLENFVDKMVERGEISRYEADNLFDNLIKKGKEQREEIEKISKDTVKKYLDLNDYVKKSDIDQYIKEEIERQLKEKNKEE